MARDRVLAAGDVKMNEIAKSAGVGQGTLYRHFPTREALLAEVYRDDVAVLVAAAPQLLTRHQPVEALRLWFGRVAQYARVKRGIFSAATESAREQLVGHSAQPIHDAVTALLDAGKATGEIRQDVEARDVILLLGFLTRLDDAEWEVRADRILDVIRAGLRP
ncbi:TetR/AcrR family transcriptional regulator [Mycolicibacterium litorale]|uniref:TetR/AcrR family transcriptional regulator n=1 Tax=Mycolicibacterium litorale TaxID=758802 RepID=UPI003CEF8BB6